MLITQNLRIMLIFSARAEAAVGGRAKHRSSHEVHQGRGRENTTLSSPPTEKSLSTEAGRAWLANDPARKTESLQDQGADVKESCNKWKNLCSERKNRDTRKWLTEGKEKWQRLRNLEWQLEMAQVQQGHRHWKTFRMEKIRANENTQSSIGNTNFNMSINVRSQPDQLTQQKPYYCTSTCKVSKLACIKMYMDALKRFIACCMSQIHLYSVIFLSGSWWSKEFGLRKSRSWRFLTGKNFEFGEKKSCNQRI